MSSTGRVEEGFVTQEESTLDDGNNSLDASFSIDTDTDVRAATIAVMSRADAILVANGRGTREERIAARRQRLEAELNGDTTDEEEEGRPSMGGGESLPAAVSVAAARNEGMEVEFGGGGEEDYSITSGQAMSFDPALNQFLCAAPMKPDLLKNDDWPKLVAPRVKMSANDKGCVDRANANIAKAVEMGKRIYEKACQDHVNFVRIIKSGATALTGARKEKAKAKANLKKSLASVAAAPDCAIIKIQKAHADEKVEELTKTKANNEKKIDKLEKKVEELEKELKKVKSSTSTAEADAAALEAHRKKKQIDHEALQMKWDEEEKRQERKEAKKMNLKNKRFKNLEPLYKSGGSFNGRFRRSPSSDCSRGQSSRRSSNHHRSGNRSRSTSHHTNHKRSHRDHKRSRRDHKQSRRRSSSRSSSCSSSCPSSRSSSSRSLSSSCSGSPDVKHGRRHRKRSHRSHKRKRSRTPPHPSPPRIPNGIKDPTPPPRDDALGLLEESGRSFSNSR